MNATAIRLVCRILLVCMASLSFQARAGLVGTGEAAAAAAAEPARAALARHAGDAAVAARMQALGLTPEQARERLAALTDAEATLLAERIGRLPAGGEAGSGLVALMLVVFLLYLFWREVILDGVK